MSSSDAGGSFAMRPGEGGGPRLTRVVTPLVLFVLIIRSMDAFRIFDQVFVMTGGGPGTTTQTITFYNYVMAFRMLRMGRASALGVVTLLILSVVIGFWIYLLYRREKGEW
jgi:multiple sugar transport system permease protein